MLEPFVPEDLPPLGVTPATLIRWVGQADRSLATYAGILEALPNRNVLLSPLTTQEAVLSSRIEGTQANLRDVLKFDAGQEPAKARRAGDVREIVAYRNALAAVESELSRRPFSVSLLKALHAILLEGTRGGGARRGDIRKTQNWIGAEGTPIEQAVFVPPPPGRLLEHLDAWMAYYASSQDAPLIQLAVVHAQFEALHPFDDGNGRLGRILIPLFLFEKALLPAPMFFMSAWLEERRDEYVAKLRAIGREPAAWNEWCAFFLRGVEEQARENAQTARGILGLYERLKSRVIELTNSRYAVPLLDEIFKRPVFHGGELRHRLGANAPTPQSVFNLVNALRDDGILTVVRKGAGRRPSIYALQELLKLCEGKSAS